MFIKGAMGLLFSKQTVSRLTDWSREVSNPRDMGLGCLIAMKFARRFRQQCCRGACQIQNDMVILTPNLTASRLREICETPYHLAIKGIGLIVPLGCQSSGSSHFASPMVTSSNGNIFRITGHLCGEFTGHRWIPRTMASNVELWCFLWSAPE